MKEEEIVKKARKGDKKAFGKLYDEHISSIYRFIIFKVNTKSEAEDITQKVFLKAWQNIHSFKTKKGAKFSSWLYRIAKNAVIDHYRTSKDHTDIEDVKHSQKFASSPEIEQKLQNSKKFKEVKEALKNLTEDEQEVIVMKFIEELSNKEIGKALDKTQGAVRVTQHRALKKLKNFFQENEK